MKHSKSSRPLPDRGPGNFQVESHHELWIRLARIENMHGTPGERKKGKRG